MYRDIRSSYRCVHHVDSSDVVGCASLPESTADRWEDASEEQRESTQVAVLEQVTSRKYKGLERWIIVRSSSRTAQRTYCTARVRQSSS
ncbi:hypothetical protein IG631_11049 [Alternaria alternata]|nr:hypothetical protein IG631_11049 [Alternaria alternata]